MVNLYVDVDGVLNAVSRHVPDWDWPDDRLVEVDGYPIRWSPTMLARLERVAARPGVTPCWLTTWGHRAADLLAPALGLDAEGWAVLGDVERERAVDTVGDTATWWKLDAIRAHLAPGTAAVWIDDDLRRVPEAVRWAERRGDVLAVAPATEFALTPGHLERIEAFVDDNAPA